jgi:hypothetical protein
MAIIVFVYCKNVIFAGKKVKTPNFYRKISKKIQLVLPTTMIAFGLDMNDLLFLEEKNSYNFTIATMG